MDITNIALLSIGASLFAFFNQIKEVLMKFRSLVIKTNEIQAPLAHNVLDIIHDDIKLIFWGNDKIVQWHAFVHKYNLFTEVTLSYFKNYIVIYKGKTPLIISECGDGVSITYLVGTFPLKNILELESKIRLDKSIKEYDKNKKRHNFYVTDITGADNLEGKGGSHSGSMEPPGLGRGRELAGIDMSNSPPTSGLFSNPFIFKDKLRYYGLSYSDVNKDVTLQYESNKDYFWSAEAIRLDKEINFWLENRKWYNDRGLSWKRGALLTGLPGTGKSQLVLRCAEKHGIPIKRLHIAGMSNNEFISAFTSNNEDGCILLIEDIDAIFDGRNNILASNSTYKQLMSFDCLINTMSGIKNANGCFVIVTTNHKEKLDPALTRAGRLDAVIEIKPLCYDGRKFIASNILRDWPDIAEKAVNECDGATAADFENHCIIIAIDEKNKQLV